MKNIDPKKIQFFTPKMVFIQKKIHGLSEEPSPFGVNLECFAEKLVIWSKTPNFGLTKKSEHMATIKLNSYTK